MSKASTKPNYRPIEFNEGFVSFLRDEARKAESKRDANVDSVNRVELALCGQLMLVSSVLLTGGILWFSSRDVTISLTPIQKWVLIVVITSLATSISAGIKYYFGLNKFFQDWAASEDKIADVYKGMDFTTWEGAITKIKHVRKGLPTTSNDLWLKVQVACLGVSGFSLILMICGVLFDLPIIK